MALVDGFFSSHFHIVTNNKQFSQSHWSKNGHSKINHIFTLAYTNLMREIFFYRNSVHWFQVPFQVRIKRWKTRSDNVHVSNIDSSVGFFVMNWIGIDWKKKYTHKNRLWHFSRAWWGTNTESNIEMSNLNSKIKGKKESSRKTQGFFVFGWSDLYIITLVCCRTACECVDGWNRYTMTWKYFYLIVARWQSI